jgi:GNAT superfamily N-acetyltransferase
VDLHWVREESPRWDQPKRSVFGVDGPHVFGLDAPGDGEILADEWWRADDDGETVGYGRLDSVWGDAEILIAVTPRRRGTGIAKFILDRLEDEARQRGLNYVYNTVGESHPDHAGVTAWLAKQGFTDHGDGALRKQVGRNRPTTDDHH